jgi:hypothetical protein
MLGVRDKRKRLSKHIPYIIHTDKKTKSSIHLLETLKYGQLKKKKLLGFILFLSIKLFFPNILSITRVWNIVFRVNKEGEPQGYS